MRFHERPVRCASSILLLKILSDKHSRGCYRRISYPPDTEFSLHHVSTSQTQTFSKSRFKNTAIYFPAVTDFFTSGEVGLAHAMRGRTPALARGAKVGGACVTLRRTLNAKCEVRESRACLQMACAKAVSQRSRTRRVATVSRR